MSYEIIFKIIELSLQLIMIIIAWKALFVWKSEIRGRDRHKLAKELLEYIEKLRFLVYSENGSLHQIYLNDILVNRKKFYNNQITSISKEKIYFDYSIFGLFSHLDIRSDMFLTSTIRSLMNELCPYFGERISSNKNQYSYIHLTP